MVLTHGPTSADTVCDTGRPWERLGVGDFLPGVCCSSKQEYMRQFRGDGGFPGEKYAVRKLLLQALSFLQTCELGETCCLVVPPFDPGTNTQYLCFQAFAKLDKDKEMNRGTCVKET